jgi:hypothetical protein
MVRYTLVAWLPLVVAASGARADTKSLDTFGGSGWQVQRILVGGEADTTAYNGPAVQTTNTPGNGGTPGDGTWIVFNNPAQTPYDPTAKWVSWSVRAGNSRFITDGYFDDANGTTYLYSNTFTLGTFGGGAHLDLTGYMAADNYVNALSLKANGVDVPFTTSRPLGADPAGYYSPIQLQSSYNFTGPTQFVLTITVLNTGSAGAGPTGLIFSGSASATAVPEPASLALLALGIPAMLMRPRKGR